MRLMVVLVALTVVMLGLPALAQEEGGEETTTTVGESTTTVPIPEPAVPADEPPPDEPAPEWTYRYLIPTGLVIGVAAIFLTAVQYFTRVVRNRYRVVK